MLQKQKVIIIGASSGMGRELAKLYAKNNCIVGVTGRRIHLLNALRDEFPGNIIPECFDVTSGENLEHLKYLIQQTGGMDLLIYCSGSGEPSEQLDMEIDSRTVKTNVAGFTEIINFAFNYFLKQGSGHIAAISSIAACRGSSHAPAYSASKAFMSNYMEGLFIKASKLKCSIYTTDIQPGFVKTSMAKGYGQFWIAPVEKAAAQIYAALAAKKRKVYITKRWRIIAWLMHAMPLWMYKKIG